MEADFTIRNEVESVNPKKESDLDESYDDFMHSVKDSSNPFLSTPQQMVTPSPSSFSEDTSFFKKQIIILMRQQRELIKQQQDLNSKVINSLIGVRFWKVFSLVIAAILVYILFFRNKHNIVE